MRDANGLESIDGMDYVASVPDGEIITDMVVCDGVIFISTGKHIYCLTDKKHLELVD